jgi:type I restriction enzyme S subunit
VTRPSNLVVNPMWLVGGGIGVSQVHGAVSPDYRVYELSDELHPPYVHYLLRSQPYRDQYKLYTRADTTFDRRVSKENFHPMPLLIPPIEEQYRIADYLDETTTLMDKVAEARRRQIGLLEQRLLSRVYDAIRGADEPGKRSESGIPWLGTLPSDWPTASIFSQFDVKLGKMLNQERVRGDHLRSYLRNTNVQWDFFKLDDLLLMDFPPEERIRFKIVPGDLLICEGGEPGRAAIWEGQLEEIYYQKALHRARSRGRSSTRWLYYCLRAATALNVFSAEGNTTTIAHLTGEQLRAHRFPFPDREIQARVVTTLDAKTALDDKLISALNKQLKLLEVRRQALVTAAVTGQIGVMSAHNGTRVPSPRLTESTSVAGRVAGQRKAGASAEAGL